MKDTTLKVFEVLTVPEVESLASSLDHLFLTVTYIFPP